MNLLDVLDRLLYKRVNGLFIIKTLLFVIYSIIKNLKEGGDNAAGRKIPSYSAVRQCGVSGKNQS